MGFFSSEKAQPIITVQRDKGREVRGRRQLEGIVTLLPSLLGDGHPADAIFQDVGDQ